MGIPLQYSLDIPKRCLDLLSFCEKRVAESEEHARRYGGPLDTTLLLALASQMILLPIERIMKHLDEDVVGYTDDRQLLPDVSHSIQERIRGKKLRNNAELAGFGWSFMPRTQLFKTSHELPEGIAKSLSSDEANASAQDMPMDQFISCLRNSLAHGGVMYLDQQGYSSRKAAEMLLFVSAKQTRPAPFVDEKTGKIIVPLPVTDGLRLLRIATRDFRRFLSSWTEWLDGVGILKEIAA